jgi:hypothetical protein
VANVKKKQQNGTKKELMKKAGELQNERSLHSPRSGTRMVFVWISIFAIVIALAAGIGQLLSLFYQEINGAIHYVLRIYVVLFSALVVVNELEWFAFTRESRVLHSWVSRGLLYSFVGVIALQENEVTPQDDNPAVDGAMYYVAAADWAMLGIGMLYFVMGVICLQRIDEKHREDYKNKKLAVKRYSKSLRKSGRTRSTDTESLRNSGRTRSTDAESLRKSDRTRSTDAGEV